MRDHRLLTPYLFIAPAVLVMAAGLVYPVVDAFYLSFHDWKIGTPFERAENVGWDNYLRMLGDPDVRESIWVTFRFGFWTITIEMALGIALALMRLIDVFRALEVMYIMTGGGPGRSTELLSLHIYNRAFDAQLLGYASAISVLLIVIVFALSAAILIIGNPMKEQSDV